MVSYWNVDDMLEGYKIKSTLPFKIFSTLKTKVEFNKGILVWSIPIQFNPIWSKRIDQIQASGYVGQTFL